MRLFVLVVAVLFLGAMASVLAASEAMSRSVQRFYSPCVWSPFEVCGVTAS